MTVQMRVALFIDSENISYKHAGQIMELCRSLGHLTIARCYGGTGGLKKWEIAIAKHHIVSMLTLNSAEKSNSSDFALTIDAVSLLHRNMYDCGVLAASDADFLQLAVHIREHGKTFHGIGDNNPTESFKSAFTSFTDLSGAKPARKTAIGVVAKTGKATSPKKGAPAAREPSPKGKHMEELLMTYHKLATDGPVTTPKFGKTFRGDHPLIEVGKNKMKKVMLAESESAFHRL